MELTEEERNYLRINYSYYIDHKEEAENYFKESWKTISDYAAKIWYWKCDKIYWTKEELEDLKDNYFYYLDNKDEAEVKFKTIWECVNNKASKLGFTYNTKGWSKEEIDDLRENYFYYVGHIEEAKNHFRRRWSVINKKALKMELLYDTWTHEQLVSLKENYFYYIEHKNESEIYFRKSWNIINKKALSMGITSVCHWTNEEIENLKRTYFYYLEHKEEAEVYFQRNWVAIHSKVIQLKITSMKINKKCPMFLGCHVAERVLSHVFKDVKKMLIHNKGFDFICNRGFKVDSKASCLNKNNAYTFIINNNKIADYFLCIGFDNRKDLNPQHIWLIRGDELLSDNKKFNDHRSLVISNGVKGLSKFSKYELTDKLKETIACCDTLKGTDDSNKIDTESEIEK